MTNRPWIQTIALLLALVACLGPVSYAAFEQVFPGQEPSEEVIPLNAPAPEPEPFRIQDPDAMPAATKMKLLADGQDLGQAVYLHEGHYYVHIDVVAGMLQQRARMIRDEVFFDSPWGQVRMVRNMPNFFCGDRIYTWYDAPPLLCEDGMLVAVKGICRALGMGYLEDEAQGLLYLTTGAGPLEIPAGVQVPVLMYHCISDEITGDGVLYVSPETMEAQLRYLTENGFTTIFLHELAFADRYEKPVILTVDDGYTDNYTELFPLLKKYNCKATIFVVTDLVDKAAHKMTSQQLRELADSGLVSIQSHTASHSNLKRITRAKQQQELLKSREDICRITGRMPYALCFPYGSYNRDTLELVQTYYTMGLQIGNADFLTGTDRRCISRWYVKRATTMEEFIEMVQTQQKDEIE